MMLQPNEPSSLDRRAVFHEAMDELNEAWRLLASSPDAEHWEVANARVSAAMALAQAVVRDEKRSAGFPLNSPDFRVPWLSPPPRPRPRFAEAS